MPRPAPVTIATRPSRSLSSHRESLLDQQEGGVSPPPWQATVAPETYDARSLARNAATLPTSSGRAIRPSGMVALDRGDRGVVAVVVVGLLGAAEADVDRVDPHLRRPLHRQRRGQRVETGLRRAVRRDGRRRAAGGDRGDVDDRAAGLLLLHHRVGRLRAEQRGEQVEADDLVVEARRRGRGVGRRRSPGVVDQDVQAAQSTSTRPAPARPRGRARRRPGASYPAPARPPSASRSPRRRPRRAGRG